MQSRLTAERSGFANSVLKQMCGSGGIAGVAGTISLRVYAKNKEWYSCSSSSSGGEGRPQDQQEEIRKLRAQIELLSGAGRTGEKRVTRTKSAGWRLRRKRRVIRSWMSKERICKGGCETSISSPLRSRRSERSKKRSLCVCCSNSKGKRQTFCLSTRKYKRGHRSCKACRIRKSITSSEEEMHKIDEDMADMRARFQALSEKSGESQRAASEVEEEIQILQARGKVRKLCVAVKRMSL